MTINDLTLVVALISTAFSTVATVRARNVKVLAQRAARAEIENQRLYQWQYAARLWIAELRANLADRGINCPPPPPELELTFNAAAG